MAATETYDALSHNLVITTTAGITFFAEGAQDGDYITVEYENDMITASEGAHGDIQFSQRKASLGTISFNNHWGSITNKNFNYLFDQQQVIAATGVDAAVITRMEVQKGGGEVVWTAEKSVIQKPAGYTIGSEASPREWSFKVSQLKVGPDAIVAPVSGAQ